MTTEPTDLPDAQLREIYRLVGLEWPTFRRGDLAELSGADPHQSVRWWRAMGFPEVDDDEIAFGQEDLDMITRLQELLGSHVVRDEDILRLARILGASFSRIVDAQLALVQQALNGDRASADVLHSEIATPDAEVFRFFEQTMSYVWRRHLLAALAHQLSCDHTDGVQAVGFADLSGFSRVSKKATAAEIAEIVETFETTAFDVVSTHEGRVVKLIGDEVMFVADELDDAIDIAIDLIVQLARVDLVPPIHCGLAIGPTVMVGGDVFGPTVNLASRLTNVARPDTVVVPRHDSNHLLDRNDLDARVIRRPYDLKGAGRTRLISVRPKPSVEDT